MDLNADVGELGPLCEDAALLEWVTSASVACGAHAGDPVRMRETCRLAVAHGVAIGAHVGYPDPSGFGRRAMELAPGELTAEVVVQAGGLVAAARSVGGEVTYVKPHGALYHRLAREPEAARAVVEALRALPAGLAVLGPPAGALARACTEEGLAYVAEGFADREYTPDGGLAPREQAGSVLGARAAARQAVALALEQRVTTAAGDRVTVEADSVCVHGDAPGAAGVARAVAGALREAGVELRRFA